jgi:hypothetical protein
VNTNRLVHGLFSFLVLLAQPAAAAKMQWNLNDVSYLFALPQGDAQAALDLLGPREQSGSGPLLPKHLYSRIPTLLLGGNGNETLYNIALRVVAARIDPCPGLDADACSPEIRLVWQPVEFDQYSKKWLARDAAVHCFYSLPAEAFESLKQDLWKLKLELANAGVDTKQQALFVHPALQNEATAKLFNPTIQQILLKYTGRHNLDKITFVALMTPKQWWRFGAFEKTPDGQWRTADIPRLDLQTVDIFNVAVEDGVGLGNEAGIDAIFNIFPEEYPEDDNIFAVINKGFRFNDARDRAVFESKLDPIARFRNPHRSNTDTLDCASCHYADATREYISKRFPELGNFSSPEQYPNPAADIYNLANRTVAATSGRNVRAFGFFDDQPVISQRTINESAAVADWLNSH